MSSDFGSRTQTSILATCYESSCKTLILNLVIRNLRVTRAEHRDAVQRNLVVHKIPGHKGRAPLTQRGKTNHWPEAAALAFAFVITPESTVSPVRDTA